MLDFANKRWIGGLNLLSNRSRHYQSERFEAAIEDMKGQNIDHVLCTGDITNLAFKQEFEFAKSLFEKFSLPPSEVTVLPGNHDAYVKKGAEHFHEIFQEHFVSDDGMAQWPLLRTRGNISIVGLSTSLQTPWFTAYGVVGKEQLTKLDAMLAAIPAGQLKLVALHHPVVGKPAESRIRGLKDREALVEVLQKYEVDVVLHGHEHRSILSFAGKIPVLGVPSGTYSLDKPNRRASYRVLTIEGNKITKVERRFINQAGDYESLAESDSVEGWHKVVVA